MKIIHGGSVYSAVLSSNLLLPVNVGGSYLSV